MFVNIYFNSHLLMDGCFFPCLQEPFRSNFVSPEEDLCCTKGKFWQPGEGGSQTWNDREHNWLGTSCKLSGSHLPEVVLHTMTEWCLRDIKGRPMPRRWKKDLLTLDPRIPSNFAAQKSRLPAPNLLSFLHSGSNWIVVWWFSQPTLFPQFLSHSYFHK